MDLYGFRGFLGPGVGTRAWGPTNKQSTCPCKVGKKAGSEVPRSIFYGFHQFYMILIDLYGFHGFLGPGVGHPVATCGNLWRHSATESGALC